MLGEHLYLRPHGSRSQRLAGPWCGAIRGYSPGKRGVSWARGCPLSVPTVRSGNMRLAPTGTTGMPQNLPSPTSREPPRMGTIDDTSRDPKMLRAILSRSKNAFTSINLRLLLLSLFGNSKVHNLIITLTNFPVFSGEICLKQRSIGGEDWQSLELHMWRARYFHTPNSLPLVSLHLSANVGVTFCSIFLGLEFLPKI